MIIARHGNKSKIASEIIKYFPIHDVYVELFFGGGGMFFNKPKAKYNFLNDLDNQVYLTYKLLQTDKRGLIKKLSD